MPECQCEKCQQACKYRPGWFLPGEAEKVARFLNLTLQELFDTYLWADYWVRMAGGDIYLLGPAVKENVTGRQAPFWPTGECVFFTSGLCAIHPVKPFECREAMPCQEEQPERNLHQETAMAWDNPRHQQQVMDLLAREEVR